jgi:hypothetical protein
MMFKEIIAVCSDNHTKHLTTVCGKMHRFLMLNQVIPLCFEALDFNFIEVMIYTHTICDIF